MASYDNDHVSIDGHREIASTLLICFQALGCHLIWVKNGNDGQAKVSNSRGEASVSAFNEEAEKILGSEMNIKSHSYQITLKQVNWVPHLFRVSVAQKIVMLQVSTDGELRLIMVDFAVLHRNEANDALTGLTCVV
ncbi:hypothetical protein ACFE04_026496 [Oxalis oulophora]